MPTEWCHVHEVEIECIYFISSEFTFLTASHSHEKISVNLHRVAKSSITTRRDRGDKVESCDHWFGMTIVKTVQGDTGTFWFYAPQAVDGDVKRFAYTFSFSTL